MLTQTWRATGRAHLLQKIILLRMLREIMEPPSELSKSDIVNHGDDNVQRVMSLQREKELAESLAYLASWSDDPAHIVAVCTEESPDRSGMTISLAVNSGSLERVVEGFQKMAKILERVARKGHETSNDRDEFLCEAISLNRARILCRLRSRHANYKCNYSTVKKSQPKRLPLIAKALKNPTASRGVPSSNFATLVADAEILNRLSTELESLATAKVDSQRGLRLLVSIVMACKQLQSRPSLHLALTKCSQSIKASTEVMTGFIARISRYYAASSFLLRAATKFSIFSLIKVSPIMIRAPKVPKTDLDPFAATVIDDLSNGQHGGIPNRTLKKPALKIKEEICLTATAKSYPIHAEIQLLLHYERHFSNHSPRVISSYKKACYLCSLFFRLHGKFIIPSTHGKLYEKWALPENIETFQVSSDKRIYNTLQRFVLAVEEAVRAVVVSAQHRPIKAPHESVIFLSPVWSIASQTAAQNVTGDQTSMIRKTTAVRQSHKNQELFEKAIAVRSRAIKSVQETASSIASAVSQAEVALEMCNSDPLLNEHDPQFNSQKKADPKSISEQGSLSLKNSSHSHLRSCELHAIAENNPFIEVTPELEFVSSAKESVINLCPVPKSITPSNNSSETTKSLLQQESSLVASSAATFNSAYLPLKRGETVSKELSMLTPYFKVGTPRLHIALSYDQAIEQQQDPPPKKHGGDDDNIVVNHHRNNAIPISSNVRYRVYVKWLHPDEIKAQRSNVIVTLDNFPRGSQKTLELQDGGGEGKDLWLSRGNDLIRVTYCLLKLKRESESESEREKESQDVNDTEPESAD